MSIRILWKKIYDMLHRSHFCALKVMNQEVQCVFNGHYPTNNGDGWSVVGNRPMAFHLAKRIDSFYKMVEYLIPILLAALLFTMRAAQETLP
jgi:hypothetical protein